MNLIPVVSTAIKAIGHDPVTNTLMVQFTNGGTYAYAGVDKAKAEKLMFAKSIGEHFARHISPHHQGVKVST